ncbi:MAG: CRTAC1 family protein [Planctomycetes bacterium]|nr:CRTAC1 family protein [Planctomycetota bacterium]
MSPPRIVEPAGKRRTRSRGFVAAALAQVTSLLGACSPAESDKPGAQPAATQAWFVDRAHELGVDFEYEAGASGKRYMPEIAGAGVALFDADGDGRLDLFFPNGNRELPLSKGSGAVLDRLYLARGSGEKGFVDPGPACGLTDPDYSMGVAIGDIDDDGDRDLLLTNLEGVRLYRNDGQGHFEDATAALGLQVSGWCTSCSFVDYDRDGYLDLFIARYLEFDPQLHCTNKNSRPDYCGPKAYPPVSDVLLHNEGGTHFTDVSGPAGMNSVRAPGLGVVCADFDADGWVDIYVANDGYANHMWLNGHDGSFHEAAFELGVALNMSGHAEAGMGVVAADFDGDGTLDLFITHLADESNILYLSRGPGKGYRDATGRSGAGASSMPFTGFGVVAFDADLDGDLDLVVANGRVNRADPRADSSAPSPWDELAEPNLFYLNDGSAHFALAPEQAGELARAVEVSRGLALGDIDDDGDLDLVVANTASRARVYVNEAPRAGHWLRVRAVDPRYRREALGALVTLHAGGRSFLRCIESSSSYLSSSDSRAHFGLGPAQAVESIEVLWPDGLRERFSSPGVDRTLELVRGGGTEAK